MGKFFFGTTLVTLFAANAYASMERRLTPLVEDVGDIKKIVPATAAKAGGEGVAMLLKDGADTTVLAPTDGTIVKKEKLFRRGASDYYRITISFGDGEVEIAHFTSTLREGATVRAREEIGTIPVFPGHRVYLVVNLEGANSKRDYAWLSSATSAATTPSPTSSVQAPTLSVTVGPITFAAVQRNEPNPTLSVQPAVPPTEQPHTPSSAETEVCGREGCMFPTSVREKPRASQLYGALRRHVKKDKDGNRIVVIEPHGAYDDSARFNEPVGSLAAGTVKKIVVWVGKFAYHIELDGNSISVTQKVQEGGGQYATVCHATGYCIWYMHLNEVLVYPGNHVQGGELLGTAGTTGISASQPHVHVQITRGLTGKRYNPARVFATAIVGPIRDLRPPTIVEDRIATLASKLKEPVCSPELPICATLDEKPQALASWPVQLRERTLEEISQTNPPPTRSTDTREEDEG